MVGRAPDAPDDPLDRPRDIGALLRHTLALLAARPLAFLAIGAAFAVPIELAVSGLGLEQLSGPYEKEVETVELVVGSLTSYVLVTPLVTVGCALLVAGSARSPGRAILKALELSTPLLLAALAAVLGVTVGLFLLILPGLYLVVRWFLFPQAVAIEERTGLEPLRRSGQLVARSWFRAAGVVLAANLLALIPGTVIVVPFRAWAAERDREWPELAGAILAETVTAPIVAVMATLLFFDLRARQARAF